MVNTVPSWFVMELPFKGSWCQLHWNEWNWIMGHLLSASLYIASSALCGALFYFYFFTPPSECQLHHFSDESQSWIISICCHPQRCCMFGNIVWTYQIMKLNWDGPGDRFMGSRLQSTYCTILEFASFFCLKGHLLSWSSWGDEWKPHSCVSPLSLHVWSSHILSCLSCYFFPLSFFVYIFL